MFFSHPIDPLRTQILRQFWWEKADATSFSPINFGGFRGDIDPLGAGESVTSNRGLSKISTAIEAPQSLSIQRRRPPWTSRWWQLKYFLFPPRSLGKMNPFWRAYFSIGLVQPPTRFPKLVTFPSSVGGHFGLNDSLGCLWMPGASWSTGTDARRGWGPNCSYKLFCFTLARN